MNGRNEKQPPREITEHKVDPTGYELKITVGDEPGHGGANHLYIVEFPNAPARAAIAVHFQNGTIPEAGVNGLTHEALLAIVVDRLRCFQAGPFANDYNAAALQHLQAAQTALMSRAIDRMARGVEGKHEV